MLRVLLAVEATRSAAEDHTSCLKQRCCLLGLSGNVCTQVDERRELGSVEHFKHSFGRIWDAVLPSF